MLSSFLLNIFIEILHGIRALIKLKGINSFDQMEKLASKTLVASIDNLQPVRKNNVVVPSKLKFLINNMKATINTQLITNKSSYLEFTNFQTFVINTFNNYLNWSTPRPAKLKVDKSGNIIPNLNYSSWMLIIQNLDVALYSMIFSSLLPYVLNLDSRAEI